MDEFIVFLFKVNCYLAVFYCLFLLLFSSNTFHRLNRVYLLSGLMLSFILPLISVPTVQLVKPIPVDLLLNGYGEQPFHFNEPAVAESAVSYKVRWQYILIAIYVTGSCIMAFVFLKNILNIIKVHKDSRKINLAGIKCYSGMNISQPFSFFHLIFIPKLYIKKKDVSSILMHEKAHAKQLHTLDMILFEIALVFLWFNPFVFLLRSSLKHIHEFLADENAIESDCVKADYLRLICTHAGQNALSGLASQFYWLTIKKRIKMITRNRTSGFYKLGYFIIIPVIIVLLMAFSGRIDLPKQVQDNISNIPSIKPVAERSVENTSGYGMRMHPFDKVEKMHNGIDFAAKKGVPVIATANGIVIKKEFVEEGKGYGRLLVIQHDEVYSTFYSQLSEYKVEVGDKVEKGQVIGLVGNSGLSTGPHLHYEVWKNGERVDPEDYFE